MYAVIATGGKQYRVREGDILDVERLAPKDNGTVDLRPVMLVDDDGQVTVARDALDSATVRAAVVDQGKMGKITIFKYRPKNRYRRKAGHRQPVTRIRVDEIKG